MEVLTGEAEPFFLFCGDANKYIRNCWCGFLVALGAPVCCVCKLLCLVCVLGVQRDGLALPSKGSGGREMHNGKYKKW